jgi:predicted membrane chloride channel (bestrophin family)
MHDPGGVLIGFLSLFGFIISERLVAFTENPFEDRLYALPINRICATISENLLSIDHPLSFTDLDLTP